MCELYNFLCKTNALKTRCSSWDPCVALLFLLSVSILVSGAAYLVNRPRYYLVRSSVVQIWHAHSDLLGDSFVLFCRLITAGCATTPCIPSQPFTSEVLSRQLLFLASVWRVQTQTGDSSPAPSLISLSSFSDLLALRQHTSATQTRAAIFRFSSVSCVGGRLQCFCLPRPLRSPLPEPCVDAFVVLFIVVRFEMKIQPKRI